MGESLRLQVEPTAGDEDDAKWRQIHGARPMSERLERAFDAAAFVGDLRGAARSR
jgi:hypothetical protein